jgi:2-amino-4-hydroxy-6-hydroxymethyldihydropteridine diphosphokinase
MPMAVAAASDAWVALGGNQGDTRAIFRTAVSRLAAAPGITLQAVSSLYQTPPWGDAAQPPFLNAVLRLNSDREPLSLLRELQALEEALGRRRDPGRRWGPRTLDLDLLLQGQSMVDLPELTVPHPRLHERAFVLIPLNELEPGLVIPGTGSVAELLEGLDRTGIEAVSGPAWVGNH